MIATYEGVIPRDWSVERGGAFYGMVYVFGRKFNQREL